MEPRLPIITDAAVLAARGPKNSLRVDRPYAYLTEPELNSRGTVDDVATVFLTNRECPFRCLMCDLWKNTTNHRVPRGAIPEQIEFALAKLPPARRIKLYNSGNFFDKQAIPAEDLQRIAELVCDFETVVVENHPRFCGPPCLQFRDHIRPAALEVAIGLETIHPHVLPSLNKQMTVETFREAVEFLVDHGIRVRSFVLLKPPFLSESEGVDWAVRSVNFAFDCGVTACAIIPVRGGNGIMEQLAGDGHFAAPTLCSLEEAAESALALRRGRVFVDLWDVQKLAGCPDCFEARVDRLRNMNLTQIVSPSIACACRS